MKFIDIFNFKKYFKRNGDKHNAKIGHINYALELLSGLNGGVYWPNSTPGAIGGLSIDCVSNIEAHILIDENITGNAWTFSTAGPSYSIDINHYCFNLDSNWRGISYNYTTNTLTFISDGIETGSITPPIQLQALTNIANSLRNGYLRKAFIWKKILNKDSRNSIVLNNGVNDSSIFIGSNKAYCRLEHDSIANNGTSNLWYDTSGNGNNAIIIGYMVNPKPWANL